MRKLSTYKRVRRHDSLLVNDISQAGVFDPVATAWQRVCHTVDFAMGKRKRKLSAAEKLAKKRRRQHFETIFINGKMKRVRRPPTIDGVSVDEFMLANADPIFLHQEEVWECFETAED
ncbi:MAG: hypothetical protein WD737_13735 [Gemmatimonadota bacterium]